MSEKDDEIARDDIVEELLALLDPTLDAEALRRGLLDYGLFAEKLPPAFSSVEIPETLVESVERVLDETDEKALRKGLGDRSHDFARYESLKPTNISRALGIPHPEAHILQVASLAKHWGEIRTHVETPDPQFSRIHLRRLNNSPRLFEMNYKGDERYQHEEDELGWMAEARFVVHTDISACFPSIYTHSIPWALHGKAVAKADHGVTSLFGNLLDATARGIRDTQTNGLLIGPHSSNLLSEIVLTVVDQKLVDKGYLRVSRHIDDYRYFAASYGDAERFLRDLGLELREFELSLNEKKTRIIPVDQEREEDWILALSSYPFPTPTGFVPHDSKEVFRYSQIRPYLALARQLAEEHETSAPIHYALKGVPKNLNERGRRLLCQEAINLSVSRPYLCQSIGTTIFDACPHESLGAQVSVFASTLSRQGLLRLQPDAIAHALFFALKYDARLDLSDEGILPVLDLGDCVCNVLLLLYARRFERPLIARRVKCLAHQLRRGNSKDQDQFWLLIYEVWSEKELRGGGQNFLADLKAAGYSFLSPELVHRLINS